MDVVVCRKMVHVVFLLLMCISYSSAWTTEEFELFDLVEEVNRNFYDVLGVEQSATSQEIRRAYRKLSLQLHPDKNKEEDAEVQFRQLVAVYEVLKNEEQRKNYELVLQNGLPDWKQPVFYYRRARKLGLLELSVLLFVIFTIGHYAVLWASYAEKILNEEDQSRREREKLERKSKKKRKAAEEMEDYAPEESQEKPKLTDLLPFIFCRFVVSSIRAFPEFLEAIKESMKKKPVIEESSSEDEDEDAPKYKRRQRVDPMPNIVPELISTGEKPVVYMEFKDNNAAEAEKQTSSTKSGGSWNHEDMALLAKAVAKFPGGTSRRWEKIAEMLERSESDVIKMSKQLKSGFVKSVDPSAQGLTGVESIKMKKGEVVSNDITVADRHVETNGSTQGESKKRNRPAKVPKAAGAASNVPNIRDGAGDVNSTNDEETSSSESKDKGGLWSQNQQKILEWGIKQYPKDTLQRWEKISEHITGKSKEECLMRFKYLADVIKKKKQATS